MLGAKLGVTDKQYNIVTDGLTLCYQPAFASCYPGTGTTENNIAQNYVGGLNGTLENGIQYTSSLGSNAGHFNLDGSDDYITTADESDLLDIGNTWTMDIWCKSPNWTSNDLIVWRPNNYGFNYGATFDGGTADRFHAVLNDGGWHALSSTFTPSNDVWYHLCQTADNTTHKFYINGELDVEGTYTTQVVVNTVAVEQGTWSGGMPTYNMTGQIGSFFIYNGTCLTAGQVKQNYNAGKDRYIT